MIRKDYRPLDKGVATVGNGCWLEGEKFQLHLANSSLLSSLHRHDTDMGHEPMRHGTAPEDFAAEIWQT